MSDLSSITENTQKNLEQDTRLTETEAVANAAQAVADAAIPATEKGANNGVAELDNTGKIPINRIPSLAKSSKVVADITARDAILEEDRFEGLRVHVLDASADPSVTTGSAGYILKSVLTNSDWEKAYESESLDLDLDASIDTHLNTSTATNGQILSYDTIAEDYVWVNDQTGGAGGAVFNLINEGSLTYDAGSVINNDVTRNTTLGSFIANTTRKVAQGFEVISPITITSIDLLLNGGGGLPSGNISVQIWSDSSGEPNAPIDFGTSINANTAFANAGASASFEFINLPISATLMPGLYFFVFGFDTYTSGGINVGAISPPTLPYGAYVDTGDNIWLPANSSAIFKINGDGASGFKNLVFDSDFILEKPSLANTVNVIPTSESPITFPNDGDVAYVSPNETAPGGNLTVLVDSPENLSDSDFIIARLLDNKIICGNISLEPSETKTFFVINYTNTNVDTHLNTNNASANQILSWNGTDYAWVDDQTGGGGTSYTDNDVDAHLNRSTASANQILSWTGTDYAWVEDQTGGSGGSGGLELATLSSGPITADISTHYLVDTTADAITVNLPNGNALTPTEQTIATIRFTDSTKQFSTNNLILVPATGEQINGFSIDESLFVDVTGAWVQVSWDSANSLWALNTSGGGGGGITTETFNAIIALPNADPAATTPTEATIDLVKQGRVVTATLSFYYEVDPTYNGGLGEIAEIAIDDLGTTIPEAFIPSETQVVFTRIFESNFSTELEAKLVIGDALVTDISGVFTLSFVDGSLFTQGVSYEAASNTSANTIPSSGSKITFTYLVD